MMYDLIKRRLSFIVAALAVSVSFFNAAAIASEDSKPDWEKRADAYYKDLNAVRNLVYKTVDGEDLSMDLILPAQKMYRNGFPVVIYIHGGGWSGGVRYVLHPNTLKRYTDEGIAVAMISYRLVKEGRTVLECIEDCKDAARFLALNSQKYGLDPIRFAATGHSAGAHLSLLEALAPNEEFKGDPKLKGGKPVFRCVAAFAPAVSFWDEKASQQGAITSNEGTMARLLGGKPSEKLELAKKLSPMTYLKRNSPAVLIVHGSADPLLSVNGARLFYETGVKAGADVTYIEVENGDHTFKGENTNITGREMDDMRHEFMNLHLLKDIKK